MFRVAQARRLCIQCDITGASYHLSGQWCRLECSAVPGNITNLAAVLARGEVPQHRARPDFDPPAALDPPRHYSCRVGQLEAGDGYEFRIYIYTGPKHAFISVVGQCGTGKHDSFKSRVYPYPSPLPRPPPDCRLHACLPVDNTVVLTIVSLKYTVATCRV